MGILGDILEAGRNVINTGVEIVTGITNEVIDDLGEAAENLEKVVDGLKSAYNNLTNNYGNNSGINNSVNNSDELNNNNNDNNNITGEDNDNLDYGNNNNNVINNKNEGKTGEVIYSENEEYTISESKVNVFGFEVDRNSFIGKLAIGTNKLINNIDEGLQNIEKTAGDAMQNISNLTDKLGEKLGLDEMHFDLGNIKKVNVTSTDKIEQTESQGQNNMSFEEAKEVAKAKYRDYINSMDNLTDEEKKEYINNVNKQIDNAVMLSEEEFAEKQGNQYSSIVQAFYNGPSDKIYIKEGCELDLVSTLIHEAGGHGTGSMIEEDREYYFWYEDGVEYRTYSNGDTFKYVNDKWESCDTIEFDSNKNMLWGVWRKFRRRIWYEWGFNRIYYTTSYGWRN